MFCKLKCCQIKGTCFTGFWCCRQALFLFIVKSIRPNVEQHRENIKIKILLLPSIFFCFVLFSKFCMFWWSRWQKNYLMERFHWVSSFWFFDFKRNLVSLLLASVKKKTENSYNSMTLLFYYIFRPRANTLIVFVMMLQGWVMVWLTI